MAHTIVLYMPNRGQIETETVESLLRIPGHPISREIPIGMHFYTGDSLIPRARNECAAHFLAGTAEAMLFVDSDIVFAPEDIFALWATGLDLVGADYHVSRRSVRNTEERGVVQLRDGAPLVAPVSRLPTGFLMIRRAVFERISLDVNSYKSDDGAQKYDFFSPLVVGNSYLSEDFAFSAHAVRAGFMPHLHRGIYLGHIGRKEWRLPAEQAFRKE